MVNGREQQALPVFLLVTLLHAEAGAVQWLQRTQKKPGVESQRRQGDGRDVVDPNIVDLRKEQEEPSIKSS